MPINSVQGYLKSVLNGAIPPVVEGFVIPALEAIVGPPTIGFPKGPQAYIRVRRFTQIRKSRPPFEGTLELTHEVSIIVRWELVTTTIAEQGTDPATVFGAVVDTVIGLLNAQPKQHIRVQDPYTGKKSELGLIGEQQSGEMQGPWAGRDQRIQLYGAPLTAIVRELMRG